MSSGEHRITAWSATLHFFVLAAVYVLRPLRDAMGLRGEVRSLPWLFAATLAVMAILQPGYAALVRRTRPEAFVPLLQLVVAASLLAFWPALASSSPRWPAQLFFVWASIVNLFLVSLFWSLMADVFSPTAGARRFGAVAFGGTLGSMAGSVVATALSPRYLLPAAVVCLLLATAAAQPVLSHRQRWNAAERPDRTGSGPPTRRAYLIAIGGWVLCHTASAAFAYLIQARVVGAQVAGDAARTLLFARIDLAANVLSLAVQGLATLWIIRRIGVGGTLALLPAVTLIGFVSLSLVPSLVVVVMFQVLRRATDYAAARPARELLFTVVARDTKYPAKSFVDTFVYRGGDALGGLLFAGAATTWVILPVCALWLGLALWLGQAHDAATAAGERLSGAEPAGLRAARPALAGQGEK